jgi:hypothetical protein
MTAKTSIVALAVVFVVVVGAGALYQWLVPGLSSARQEPGPVETDVQRGFCTGAFPRKRKRASTRWQTIRPKLQPVTTSSARNVSLATATTAVGRPRSGPDNIRDRQR